MVWAAYRPFSSKGSPFHLLPVSPNLQGVLCCSQVTSTSRWWVMCTYWIILILTIISTSNVPICKFKYHSMIIMQITISLIIMQINICLIIVHTIICLIIMQILYSSQRYNIVIFIHTKLIFLFVIPKYAEYQRDPYVKCISHCNCHSIVKLLYIGKGKRGIRGELETAELRCTSLCTTTMHIELYVCMFSLLVTMDCKCWFYMNCKHWYLL